MAEKSDRETVAKLAEARALAEAKDVADQKRDAQVAADKISIRLLEAQKRRDEAAIAAADAETERSRRQAEATAAAAEAEANAAEAAAAVAHAPAATEPVATAVVDQTSEQRESRASATPISIATPSFQQHHSAGYFAVLEAQFDVKGVERNDARYAHALSGLPVDIVTKLPPSVLTAKDYPGLRSAVLELFEKSKTEIFRELTASTEITGRPSLFLMELNAQARKVGVGEDLVRHRFLQALQPQAAAILAAQPDLALENLGKLADTLMQHLPQPIAYVNSRDREPRSVARQPEERVSRRDRRDAAPSGLQPFFANQRPQVCRAHLYWGAGARSCRAWCQFPRGPNCRVVDSRTSSPAPSSTASRSPSPRTGNGGGRQ